MSAPKQIWVVSGPSGVGKSTLVGSALSTGRARLAVSATTREPRPGEVEGEDYHFLSVERFTELRQADGLLEWAEVHGNFYGTPRAELERGDKELIILDVDVQGFASLRASALEFRSLFIAPPDLDTLRERLSARGTEDPARLARRLAAAEREMQAMDQYDLRIVNDDLEATRVAFLKALDLADPTPPRTPA